MRDSANCLGFAIVAEQQMNLGLGSVELADPFEAPEQVGDVASENAAVGVQLVHDDVAKVFEEPCPARVMRQNPGVQHVGIGQHHVGAAANGRRASCGVSPS